MKIRSLIVTLIYGVTPLVTASQSDTSHHVARRNEVGISVGSMVLVALGAQPYSQPTTLGYKRLFGHRWAFRTNWGITAGNPNFEAVNWHPAENDTTQRFTIDYEKRRGYSGSAGLEYRVPFWGKWLFIAGGDLQACYIENTRVTDEVTRTGGRHASSIAPFSFLEGSTQKRVSTTRSTLRQGGLALFAGSLIPVGKRLWLSGKLRYFLFYQKESQSSYNDITKITSTGKKEAFSLVGYPLLGDLALYFRF